MPKRKSYDKKQMGPFTLDDFNALGVGDSEDMVRAYGSLEAARERYFYLRDTDQIPDGHDWEAYYEFEAPEERPDEPDPREETQRNHDPRSDGKEATHKKLQVFVSSPIQ